MPPTAPTASPGKVRGHRCRLTNPGGQRARRRGLSACRRFVGLRARRRVSTLALRLAIDLFPGLLQPAGELVVAVAFRFVRACRQGRRVLLPSDAAPAARARARTSGRSCRGLPSPPGRGERGAVGAVSLSRWWAACFEMPSASPTSAHDHAPAAAAFAACLARREATSPVARMVCSASIGFPDSIVLPSKSSSLVTMSRPSSEG